MHQRTPGERCHCTVAVSYDCLTVLFSSILTWTGFSPLPYLGFVQLWIIHTYVFVYMYVQFECKKIVPHRVLRYGYSDMLIVESAMYFVGSVILTRLWPNPTDHLGGGLENYRMDSLPLLWTIFSVQGDSSKILTLTLSQGNWNLNQLTRFCAAVDQLDFVYKLGPLTMGRPRDLQRYFNRLAQISL